MGSLIRVNKLKARMVEREMTVGDVADKMGISQSTLYRKMKTGKFSVGEVKQMSEILGLSTREITEIFFSGDVA